MTEAPARRTSARFAKTEQPKPDTPPAPPAKRRKSSAVTKEKDQEVAPVVVDEPPPKLPAPDPLPTKLVEGQPLPTLPEPQALDLSNDEYQSVADSGVLAAALRRSRETWLKGTNFKVGWQKLNSRKRPKERTAEDVAELKRNRDLGKSMIKIGDCELVIDPHIFAISLYIEKSMLAPPPRPVVQYAPPVYHHSYAPSPYQHGQQPQPPSQPPRPPPVQNRPAQRAPGAYNQAPPPRPPPGPPVPSVVHPTAPAQPHPPANNGPAPDPVIQMLAHRAGQDPKLKAVMKIVANGTATAQQLEYFQGHINELTAILEKRKKTQQAAQNAVAKPHQPPPTPGTPNQPPQARPPSQNQPGPAIPPRPGNPSTPYSQQPPQTPQPVYAPPKPTPPQQQPYGPSPPQARSQSQYHAYPQPPHAPLSHQPAALHSSAGAPAPPQPPPTHRPHPPPSQPAPPPPPPPATSTTTTTGPHIRPSAGPVPFYFEFADYPDTRYLFPRDAILEYLPGNHAVKVSFLITRSALDASSPAAGKDDKKSRKEKEKEKPKVKTETDDAKASPAGTSPAATPAPTTTTSAASGQDQQQQAHPTPPSPSAEPYTYSPITLLLRESSPSSFSFSSSTPNAPNAPNTPSSSPPRILPLLRRAVDDPAAVARAMEYVMARGVGRAAEGFLALRLPIRGSVAAGGGAGVVEGGREEGVVR